MSNIRWLAGQVDAFWNKVKNDYAGFEKPQIVPAATLRGNAPLYMKRYIDQDPSSFYMFLVGNPMTYQDISRDKACEFFDQLFYEYLRMPSSYDIQAGGDYSREQAIDKEVLPAKQDSAFKTYYEEQMDILNQMMAGETGEDEPDQAEPEQADDIIDLELGDDGKYAAPGNPSSTKAVGSAATTAVGMPKPIFYAVDFHIPVGGGMLGHNGSGHLGHHGHHPHGYLHEKDKEAMADEMMQEALRGGSSVTQLLDELIDLVGENSPMGGDLLEIKSKYNLNTVVPGLSESRDKNFPGNGQKYSGVPDDYEYDPNPDDDDLSDQFTGDSHERLAANRLGYGKKPLSEDDLGEDDLLKGRKHNAHVDEDDVEDIGEDEDMLNESFVQYANRLTREIR